MFRLHRIDLGGWLNMVHRWARRGHRRIDQVARGRFHLNATTAYCRRHFAKSFTDLNLRVAVVRELRRRRMPEGTAGRMERRESCGTRRRLLGATCRRRRELRRAGMQSSGP